jgi:hypothetical protein
MRPKIAMWSDYGAPRHRHWRAPRRSSRSSIGPKILVAAVVVVAGVIGISGIYPQIIDSEWVQGTSPHSQRVAHTETAPTPRRSGIVAEIPLPPRRAAVTTGEAVAPAQLPAATPAPAIRTAAAPAPAPAQAAPAARVAAAPAVSAPAPIASAPASPARVAAAPAPAAPSPAALASPPAAPASSPAMSEMRPSVAAAEQAAADPDGALADVADAQAKADPPADPAVAAPAAAVPAVAGRAAYANRAPVVKRQRVVHVEHRQRTSGAYAQWGGGGFGFPFFGGRF